MSNKAKVVTKPRDYRYERKFLISALTKQEIESIVRLHPAMFSEVYHQRFVNNIYLDSFNMRNYFDTIDGIKGRVKVRIRWYGDLWSTIGKSVLELKIKVGMLVKKKCFPLIPFSIDQSFQTDTIVDIFRKAAIPDLLKLELISLEPTLLNRYSRRYFESADHKYRITIDSDLEFRKISARNNTFVHRSMDGLTTVVELKYDPEQDQHVDKISCDFPFRMTKSSKYVNGIEALVLC